MNKYIALFFFLLAMVALTGHAQPTTTANGYSLFLIGDCGEPFIFDSPMGRVFRREIENEEADKRVVYLGDNIYPMGMPGQGEIGRERAEKILQTQVDWIKGLDVKGTFIPGNHDWQHWNKNGWKFVINQQQFLDSLHDNNITLQPRHGCPGPVEIPLGDHAVLLIIDTQWLLHGFDKPGEDSDCTAKTITGFFTLLDDALKRNADKRVIVAGHHPMITYGSHGGVFSWQDHLFPLTAIRPRWYVPLPIVGSLHPLYRGLFGHPQDVIHPVYREYSKLIQTMLSQYPGSVYVAGHEHTLQHIVKNRVHYIVSGSGSKSSYAKPKRFAHYAKGVTGFVHLRVNADGTGEVKFWQVDKDHADGAIVHEELLMPHQSVREEEKPRPDYTHATVRVSASSQYKASTARARFLGDNYRQAWSTEIEVPVFDLLQEQGGLTVLQKGGGQQTLSLRLADTTGREYVLRSIEKYPEKAVPEMFRKTFAQDLVQDQISASHPYAAVVIPRLAAAAGIYHTNPKVVYIPDDPALGLYRKEFRNTLAIFEERPAGDWSDHSHFGNAENIINTAKVLEKITKDTDNHVDQLFVLRSRLFDLWIGDWDRHDDQWRWATFKTKKEETFRPIPRDRDQAFFVNKGMLPSVWSRRWALPKFEGFDNDIDWASGLSFNARYFDRSFLTRLERDDWERVAKELQLKLTDEVIESSIKEWPEPIYNINGPSIIEALKQRRANLLEEALSHYRFLAREVDVTGTEKNERFEVKRQPDGDVEVEVFKINKDGEKSKKIFDRTFKHNETKEVRLYGLGGEDQFIIEGDAARSILVRVIGGDGRDSILDNSSVSAFTRKTLFYDSKPGNHMVSKGELKDMTSMAPDVNNYDRKAFKYNRLAPLVYGNFNPDDGLFFGGGVLYQTEGFRKVPFKARHIILASIAPRTNSYNLLYRGDFTDIIGKWGLQLSGDLKSPNYVNNFFGLGNETVFNKDIDDLPGSGIDHEIDYYRFRFEELRLETLLKRTIAGSTTFAIGPAFQRIEIEEPRYGLRYIEEYASSLPYNLYNEYNSYFGVAAELNMDKRNNKIFTSRGFHLTASTRSMAGLDKRANDFSSLEGALSIYHSFSFPERLVFAARVGGGRVVDDYNFYQAQILSGRTELRGYRKTRFYGDSKFFINTEARLKLFNVKTYLFPASIGIVGFHDLGRVWYKDEAGIDPSANGKSSRWHRGYGGGVWFTPFNLTVLSVEAGHSREGTMGYVRLGFLF